MTPSIESRPSLSASAASSASATPSSSTALSSPAQSTSSDLDSLSEYYPASSFRVQFNDQNRVVEFSKAQPPSALRPMTDPVQGGQPLHPLNLLIVVKDLNGGE